MKKSKIIVPALGVLVLSTAASISGTVAWFTANNSVAITGMSVKTRVGSNILVAEANNVANESNYHDSLDQTVGKILEPVSSVDGLSFFYTTDVKANGSKDHNLTGEGAVPYVEYNETALTGEDASLYDIAFSKAYGVTKTMANTMFEGETGARAYADYVFYLKATNAESTEQNLRMTKCNLLYNSIAVTETSWRVAVFSQDATKGNNVSTAIAAGNRKTILALSGATNFTSGKAVASTTALGDVTYGTGAVLIAVDAGDTVYQKVTVRLWLEGEDTTCTSETFASLTSAYSLDLAFAITSSEPAAVTTIGSTPAA